MTKKQKYKLTWTSLGRAFGRQVEMEDRPNVGRSRVQAGGLHPRAERHGGLAARPLGRARFKLHDLSTTGRRPAPDGVAAPLGIHRALYGEPAGWVREGKLVQPVAKVFPLRKIGAALAAAQEKRVGKVLLDLRRQ